MTDRRSMRKHYAQGVIVELQSLGYTEQDAKRVFLRHYRWIKRGYGLNMNVNDFAIIIDEIERTMNRKYDPDDPVHIYVGHIRDRVRKADKR